MPLTRALFEHRDRKVEDVAYNNAIKPSYFDNRMAITCHRVMWKGDGKS